MAKFLSLKQEILEKLHLEKGGKKVASKNVGKAITDFKNSNAPQFRGKSSEKRREMGIAAGLSAARENIELRSGDTAIYEGKKVIVKTVNEIKGMSLVKPKNTPAIFVRTTDLTISTQLNEGVLGLAAIPMTYRGDTVSNFTRLEALTPEDIGMDVIKVYEDDETGEIDDQEEESDNGSNIRHDGHTSETEVDNLPKPSDTIAPAYSDKKPPKEIGKPLSTEPGYTVAQDPDFDGYDYPMDAPEIPKGEWDEDMAGNARQPDYSDSNQPHGVEAKSKKQKQNKVNDSEDSEEKSDHKPKKSKTTESVVFEELDDKLDGDDSEPGPEATITVTIGAMASIVKTVSETDCDDTLLKAIVEALAEVGAGKTIDVDDLEAVARHINGEEMPEMKNREDGKPDHEGIDDSEKNDFNSPSGDGEKSSSGKVKLMGADEDKHDGEPMEESWYDADVKKYNNLTEEEELRIVKRRAGLKFW